MTNGQMIEGKAAAVALTDDAAQSSGAAREVAKKPSARAQAGKRKLGAAAAGPPAKSVQATPAEQTDVGTPSRAPSAATVRSRAGGKVTKTDAVVKMLRAAKGATVAQIETVTSWQAHSVRGFLSGTVRKKLGLTLTSETGKDGERRYRIVAAPTSFVVSEDGKQPYLADGDQSSTVGNDTRAGS